jgi:hypothetical protein
METSKAKQPLARDCFVRSRVIKLFFPIIVHLPNNEAFLSCETAVYQGLARNVSCLSLSAILLAGSRAIASTRRPSSGSVCLPQVKAFVHYIKANAQKSHLMIWNRQTDIPLLNRPRRSSPPCRLVIPITVPQNLAITSTTTSMSKENHPMPQNPTYTTPIPAPTSNSQIHPTPTRTQTPPSRPAHQSSPPKRIFPSRSPSPQSSAETDDQDFDPVTGTYGQKIRLGSEDEDEVCLIQ